MKKKPTKDDLVVDVACALVKGATAILTLRKLRKAVHRLLDYDNSAPAHVNNKVWDLMGYDE